MIKCQICGKEFKTLLGLSHHLKLKHKNITKQEYYNKYLLKDIQNICIICGKESKFISITRGYKKTCCSKKCIRKQINQTNLKKYGNICSLRCKDIINKVKKIKFERYGDEYYINNNKIKETNLKKYGVKNVFQAEKIKEKIKKTNLKRYGCENPSQSDVIKQKKIDTCQKHHNTEYPIQNIKIKEKIKKTNLKRYSGIGFASKQINSKIKQTCLDKFGYEYINKSPVIKQKKKQTCLDKFGYETPLQSPIIKEKIKQTNLKRYGCENPSQNKEIQDRKVKNSFKSKEYILPSGKIIKLQGYEPQAMDELLLEYSENDISIGRKNMPEIWYYTADGKKHRYFPDIYIEKDNTIIEVKSTWTYKLHLKTNILKEEACRKAGYNFKFMIIK